MGFQEAVRTCLSKYTDFSGRARRSEYWYFTLAYILAIMVASIPEGILGTGTSILGGLVMVAGILPSLAACVRRLHDTGRSGWFYLVGLIPFVGGLILLIFTIQDSQPVGNQWGPSPKAVPGMAPAYGAPR